MKAARFKQQKNNLAEAFKSAVAADAPQQATAARSGGWPIPLLLIVTMLPVQIAGVFFSFTSLLISIIFLTIIRKYKTRVSISAFVMGTVLASGRGKN